MTAHNAAVAVHLITCELLFVRIGLPIPGAGEVEIGIATVEVRVPEHEQRPGGERADDHPDRLLLRHEWLYETIDLTFPRNGLFVSGLNR